MKSPFTSRAARGAETFAPTLPTLLMKSPWLFPLVTRSVSDQAGPKLSIMNQEAVASPPANWISQPSFPDVFCRFRRITPPPFVASPIPTISMGLEAPMFTELPLMENGASFAPKSARFETIVFQSVFFN